MIWNFFRAKGRNPLKISLDFWSKQWHQKVLLKLTELYIHCHSRTLSRWNGIINLGNWSTNHYYVMPDVYYLTYHQTKYFQIGVCIVKERNRLKIAKCKVFTAILYIQMSANVCFHKIYDLNSFCNCNELQPCLTTYRTLFSMLLFEH